MDTGIELKKLDEASSSIVESRNSTYSWTKRIRSKISNLKLGSGVSVFHFYRKQDLKVIVPAGIVTFVASFESPVLTILLGNIFDALGEFNSKVITTDDFMGKVLKNCGGIFSLAIASLLFCWSMLSLWCIFADHQVRRAREVVFKSLIHKDMKWFDEHTGIMGSLTMANRYVSLSLFLQ